MQSRYIVTLLVVAAAPPTARAEGPCDQGFILKQGAVIETTRFNSAHTAIGKTVATIVTSETKDGVTRAAMLVDNYAGANKASASTVDLVCDGKTLRMSSRNAENLKILLDQAKAAGKKGMLAYSDAGALVYPLGLKVGDTLPPYRNLTLMITPELVPQGFDTATEFGVELVEKKIASGTQMVTRDIKVIAEEKCALPDGKKVPCLHITKQVYSGAAAQLADVKKELNLIGTGAPMQQIDEWLAPGVGIVKMTIGFGGKTIISTEISKLQQ